MTNVEPGDFVISTGGPYVAGAAPARAGGSLVLLKHLQRHPEDDPDRRDRGSLPRWASAPSPTRRWYTKSQCTQSPPDTGPAVAGLLGCGVMVRISADQHRRRQPPTDTVAVIGCGGVGDAAIARAAWSEPAIIAVDTDDTKLEWAATSVPPTPSTRGPPTWWGKSTAHRRIRCRRGRSTRSAGGDLESRRSDDRDLAGTVIAGWGPDPDMRLDMPLVDFFSRGGSLKSPPGWRGLPAGAGLPTSSSCTAKAGCRSRFVSERIGLDAVGRRFQDARRCRAALGGGAQRASSGGHQRHLRTRRRQLGRRQQRLDRRRRLRGDRRPTQPTTWTRSEPPWAAGMSSPSMCHGTTTTSPAPRTRGCLGRAGTAEPRRRMLWRMTHVSRIFARCRMVRCSVPEVWRYEPSQHPGGSPGSTCRTRLTWAPCSPATRSSRAPWRYRAPSPTSDDPRVDQRTVGRIARRHRRLHQPRRHDTDRGRIGQLRRLGGAGALGVATSRCGADA